MMINHCFSALLVVFFPSFLLSNEIGKEMEQLKESFIERGVEYEFVAYTFPKGGSHLFDCTLQLLTGRKNFFYGIKPLRTVDEGIERINFLKSIGRYEMEHIPFDQTEASIREQLNCKIFYVYRDPRDIVLSFVDWIDKGGSGNGVSLEVWNNYSRDEKINSIIENVHGVGMRQLIQRRMGWLTHPMSCSVCFEDLVGEGGGGRKKTQLEQLRKIVDHIGLFATDEELGLVGESIFGWGNTFNKGNIGRWKKEFNEQHKQKCKDLFGDYLILLQYENDYGW